MKLDEQFMQNAIVRINELQHEMKEQSKQVDGAQRYVEQQVKLYKEAEVLRNQSKSLQEEAQKIANDFFSHNGRALNDTTK